MMIIIKNSWNDRTMHEIDAPTTAAAILILMVRAAEKSEHADLSDANLSGANLRGTNLGGTNLSGANLRGTDLSDADLRSADLSDANLSGANLRGTDLSDADLSDANLSGANLSDADLSDADLRGTDLSDAEVRGANLSGANLRGIVPIIADIDLRIEQVTSQHCALNMAQWHTCETTHCRAGWAIHLAGAPGAMLESWLGPSMAGALIYAASGSHPVPSFSASDNDARADIKRRADAARAAKSADSAV